MLDASVVNTVRAVAASGASPPASAVQARDASRRHHSLPLIAGSAAPRRPSVLVLNRSYWPDVEATGQLLTELCEDLATEFEITVVAGQPNQNPAGIPFTSRGIQRHRGVTIRRVAHLKPNKRFLLARSVGMLSYLASALIVATFFVRPEVIVIETDPFLLPLLGRWLRWWHKCNVVIYLQDIYPDVAIGLAKIREGWLTKFLRRRLLQSYRSANHVIVLGADMRLLMTEAGVPNVQITTLPNWVDTKRLYPIPDANRFREREGLGQKFVVMYSGNVGLCQNLDEVLDAANRIRDRNDIQFVLVGEGASRARLERIAAEQKLPNVRFFPYQPLSELAQSLSAADLHLIPLDPRVTRCLVPSKLYGILAVGVPAIVVADQRSEASRVIRDSAAGRVVAPGNPAALAEAILWCADNPEELAAMGCRARQLAEREYDRKPATQRFGQLLKHVMGTQEGGGTSADQSPGNEKSNEVQYAQRMIRFLNIALVVGLTIGFLFASSIPLIFASDDISTRFANMFRFNDWDVASDLFIDSLFNVAALLPIGFFGFALLESLATRSFHRLKAFGIVITVSFGLAILAEGLQLWIPIRTPSFRDVLTLEIGAVFGAALWWTVGKRVTAYQYRLFALVARWKVARRAGIRWLCLFFALFLACLSLNLIASPAEMYWTYSRRSMTNDEMSAYYFTSLFNSPPPKHSLWAALVPSLFATFGVVGACKMADAVLPDPSDASLSAGARE
jgi:glycosyltransferase involved in cell wall biosynthesis/glycopeptide antibiotics resistance protein